MSGTQSDKVSVGQAEKAPCVKNVSATPMFPYLLFCPSIFLWAWAHYGSGVVRICTPTSLPLAPHSTGPNAHSAHFFQVHFITNSQPLNQPSATANLRLWTSPWHPKRSFAGAVRSSPHPDEHATHPSSWPPRASWNPSSRVP